MQVRDVDMGARVLIVEKSQGHVGGTIAGVDDAGIIWPPDVVLIELGRIAWAATDLEGIVRSVCQAVIGAGDEVTRASVGRQVQGTIEVLDTWPQSEARDAGRRWLVAAQDALSGRHMILHSTIVNMVTPAPDGGWHIDPALWLQHILTRGAAGMPVELTADELLAVREILVAARRGWTQVIVGLGSSRAERWNAGQIDRSSLTKRNRYG